MAVEIPHDLIKSLQISLREQAGLSSYDPNDTTLPELPSAEDGIAELDPSPVYLRCKHCKGRLLRGINSTICVFCGRQTNKDVPPDPIKFTSTFGYRWLLQSLDLDGSELVAPSVEAKDSNRGHNAPQNEFPLSDLLDLEIRWSSESQVSEARISDKTPAQKLSTLNLAGVDLDNFFIEAKAESLSAPSGNYFALDKHGNGLGSNAFQGHGSLSLFENAQLSEPAVKTKEYEGGDSFSGWEAEFQSAGSGTQTEESKPFDSLVGSSSDNLSTHMDSIGPGKDLDNQRTTEDATSSASNLNDWMKDDSWSNFNTGNATSSSGNSTFIHDNQHPTANSSKLAHGRTIHEEENSFSTWNDFASTTSKQVPSDNSSKQAGDNAMPSIEPASVPDGKTIAEDEDAFDAWNDFGSVTSVQVPSAEHASGKSLLDGSASGSSQPDFFSTVFNHKNGSTEINILLPETTVSDSLSGTNAGDMSRAEDFKNGHDVSNGNTRSKADDVEMLLSQMHDLSFMHESSLAVPQKK
uniref:Dentin sialophosphoprotein n=1 Tax=Rhizophora mucronata TaxID=61149 RepID=A0A2P2QLI8_RHIMU